MRGLIKRLSIIISVLVVILGLSSCGNNKESIQTPVRDVELVESEINYQAILEDFDDAIIEQNGTKFAFSGKKALDKNIFQEIDNISVCDIEEYNQYVEYQFSYDYQNNIVEMSASMNNDIGTIETETIYGAAFINDKLEIDAVFLIDDEYVFLSDLQNSLLDNCGWFKKALKKAAVISAAVAVVVTATVVTTCTCGVGAVIVAGAISGAVAGGASMAISSYQETGEVQAKAVLSGIGVGAAIGAVTGYAVDVIATGMGVSAASSTVADGIAYDQVFDIIDKCDDSVDGITKYKSFTVSEINEYASKANQNANSLETYIGKYYQSGVNSYDTLARTNGKNYFYLENYDELLKDYGPTEMEKINRQFIIDKINAGNDIFSTTDPDGNYSGSFAKELEWIKELTSNDYEWKEWGENLWKLVKKS